MNTKYMTLLLLFLFTFSLAFLFYYELIWKRVERERGKNLLALGKELMFDGASPAQAVPASVVTESPWNDWKYRLTVELHRQGKLYTEEAAKLAGVSAAEVEEYLDQLEGEGKVEQAGDAVRGIFYRVAQEA